MTTTSNKDVLWSDVSILNPAFYIISSNNWKFLPKASALKLCVLSLLYII